MRDTKRKDSVPRHGGLAEADGGRTHGHGGHWPGPPGHRGVEGEPMLKGSFGIGLQSPKLGKEIKSATLSDFNRWSENSF